MKRLLLVLGLLLATCLPAAAQGCGPDNPGCLVPTAAPGTNNNQAASTAFVQAALGGGVSSVTNSDGTLVISPTTGGVVASCAVATTGQNGCARPDGTSITITGVGVLSAASGLSTNFGGRLTPTVSTPVQTVTATGVTTLYYAPLPGKFPCVSIYNGTNVLCKQFTSSNTDTVGLSLTLDTNSADTNYHASGSIFDVFVGVNSSTVTLCTGPAWTSSGVRGTGAGTTQSALFLGLAVNAVSMTCRYGTGANTFTCPQFQCTKVGSIGVPAATTTLRAAIATTGATSISTTDSCGSGTFCFPYSSPSVAWPFYVLIDSEILQVTGGNQCTTSGTGCTTYSGTWTVTRGALGTTAATHSNGATVTMAPGQTQCSLRTAVQTPGAQGGDNIQCLIFNDQNVYPFALYSRDYNQTWEYTTQATWRACGGSAANRITWLDGIGNRTVSAANRLSVRGFGDSGVAIDVTNTATGLFALNSLSTDAGASPSLVADGSGAANVNGNQTLSNPSAIEVTAGLGLHFASCQEFIDNTTVGTHNIFMSGQGYQMLTVNYQN